MIRSKDTRPKYKFKEQKEFEEIYDIIEKLEHNITEVENKMLKNSTNYGALNELIQEKESLEEELLLKYERLEYLEDINRKINEYKKN